MPFPPSKSKSSKSKKPVHGLQSAHGKSGPSKEAGDPVKGLKDAVKAKEVQALSMEAALQSGGGGLGGMR